MDAQKKKEFATYYRLHLDRQSKSRAKREAVSRKGLYVFIGGDTPDRPYLRVLKSEHVRVWQEVAAALVEKTAATGNDPEATFNLLKPHIERQVYQRLSVRDAQLAGLDREFEKRQGRPLTAHEREQYARALSRETSTSAPDKGAGRKHSMNSLLKKIRNAHAGQSDRLQQAWAGLVGADAALETQLYKVDPVKGVAYCRALNSSRSFQLQGEKDLATRLGRALQTNIRKIVFR